MPTHHAINDFLEQRHVAFVGVSRDPKQFANSVCRYLRDGGRTMYPVNQSAGGAVVEGDASLQALADVPNPVDAVVAMVPAAQAVDVVRQALDRGIERIWLHKGIGRGSNSPGPWLFVPMPASRSSTARVP
jgi:predicted CoA-binding protein